MNTKNSYKEEKSVKTESENKKHSGRPMTEEEYKEWRKVFTDIDECIAYLHEQSDNEKIIEKPKKSSSNKKKVVIESMDEMEIFGL